MLRASSAVEMTPAVTLLMLPSGCPKFVVLKRLKMSHRNVTRDAPIGKFLLTEKSTDFEPGPISVFRPAVPWNPFAGSTYAVLSNHWATVGLSSLPRSSSRPGATLTRCGTNEPHWQTLVPDSVNGNPLPARMTPCTCQSPSTYATGPVLFSQRRPFPNGSSYPKLTAPRWRW